MENGEFWSCEKDKKKHIFGLPGLGYCRQWCWGVGFSLDFIEALKNLENHEKPCFTFFAFLPPYIGVSGSLVSGMRKSVKRSIDWYQKLLISRLAARYSAVFVFFIGKIDILKLNLLSNRAVERFWDALWLGIRPFLCFCLVRGSCVRVSL